MYPSQPTSLRLYLPPPEVPNHLSNHHGDFGIYPKHLFISLSYPRWPSLYFTRSHRNPCSSPSAQNMALLNCCPKLPWKLWKINRALTATRANFILIDNWFVIFRHDMTNLLLFYLIIWVECHAANHTRAKLLVFLIC